MGVSDILLEEGGASNGNGKEEDLLAHSVPTPTTSSSSSSSPSTRVLSSCPSITTILLNTITTSSSMSSFPRSASFVASVEEQQRTEEESLQTTEDTMTATTTEIGLVAPAAESTQPTENENQEALVITTEDATLNSIADSRTSSVGGEKDNQFLVEWYKDKSEEDATTVRNNAEMIEIITPQSPEICTICIERTTDYQLANCKHAFCSECLREHFTTKVFEGVGVALGILCPDCHNEIAVSDLETLLSADVLTKYRHFKKLATLRSDPYCRWCPKPDCDTPVIGNPYDAEWPCLECTKCSTRFCYECNTRWHPKITCKKNMEMLKKKGHVSLRDEKWKKKHSKKCPRCRTDIEKDVGCNHIVCTSCSYQFCWLCMDEYSAGHYETGACANKCFEAADDDLDFIFGGRPRTPAQKVLRVGKMSLYVVGGIALVGIAIPIGFAALPFYGLGWAISKAVK